MQIDSQATGDGGRRLAPTALLDDDERESIAAANGYKVMRYGDNNATHAICRHGRIIPVTDNSHTCGWIYLVSSKKPLNSTLRIPQGGL